MPPGRHGRIARPDQRRWLSRGRPGVSESAEELLARILPAVGHAVPRHGLAGLRFWGQTGERSGAWMAAADPVHLEPHLSHLRLHAFQMDEIPRADLRELFESLQSIVGEDEQFAFARLGPFAYLDSKQPIATSAVSPSIADGCDPGEFLPVGEAARDHDRLVAELQMALHDHAVNRSRESSGKRTINSIWLWGGGTAPEQSEQPIPPLFSDDPLIRGYWLSCSGTGHAWRENLEDALNLAPEGFVAVAPEATGALPQEIMAERLASLRGILKRGDLMSVTLLFRDELSIEIRRRDAFRFWRSVSPLLMEPIDD